MSSQSFTLHGGTFTWIDVSQPTKKELKELATRYQLHPTSVQDCMEPEHLPKFERIGSVNFIIARAYDQSCGADADSVQELTRKIAIFFGDGFLITVHRRDLEYLKILRAAFTHPTPERPAPEPTPVQLLAEVLKGTLITYTQPIDDAYRELEALEIETFQVEQPADVIEQGYYLKRRVSVIERMMRLSLEMVQRLTTAQPEGGTYLQDVKEQAERSLFFVGELGSYVNNLLNLHISLQSHKTNEVVRLLTVFSVFFLPLNFLASIYGMNFAHMPGLAHPAGFALSIVAMLAVAGGIFAYFRRKGWLKRPQKIFKGTIRKKD